MLLPLICGMPLVPPGGWNEVMLACFYMDDRYVHYILRRKLVTTLLLKTTNACNEHQKPVLLDT